MMRKVRPYWTAAERATLRRMWEDCYSDDHIGAVLGRTGKAVERYRSRMGLHDNHPHRMSKVRARVTRRESTQTHEYTPGTEEAE